LGSTRPHGSARRHGRKPEPVWASGARSIGETPSRRVVVVIGHEETNATNDVHAIAGGARGPARRPRTRPTDIGTGHVFAGLARQINRLRSCAPNAHRLCDPARR